MKKATLFQAFAFLTFLACNTADKNSNEQTSAFVNDPIIQVAKQEALTTAEDLRKELIETEKLSPEQYLNFTGEYKQNWIDQWVVKGTIANSASVATFKDIEVEIHFLAQSGTDLGYKEFTAYQITTPGSQIEFKEKMYGPEATASIAIKVKGATPM